MPGPLATMASSIVQSMSNSTETKTEETKATTETPTTGDSTEKPDAQVDPAAKPEETAPEKNINDEDFSKRFTALTKRERFLTEKENALKENTKKFQTESEEFNKYKEAKALAKDDPNSVAEALKYLGWTYDEITQAMLKNPPEKPSQLVKELQDQVKSLTDKLNGREEQEKTQAEQGAISEFKNQLKDSISANQEKYEILNSYGDKGVEIAYEVCEEYFRTNKAMLPIDKAIEAAENYLVEEASKFKNIKKLGFTSSTEDSKESKSGTEKEVPKQTTTLTNTNTVLPSAGGDSLPLDFEERLAAVSRKYKRQA